MNRGGLTQVNYATFDVFVAIEEALRSMIRWSSGIPVFSDRAKHDIIEDDDVQFFWSQLSQEWEEESGDVLLEMVVRQYVTVRGFAVASRWMEKYKQVIKKSTQKTKGKRKELLPKEGSHNNEAVAKESDHEDN